MRILLLLQIFEQKDQNPRKTKLEIGLYQIKCDIEGSTAITVERSVHFQGQQYVFQLLFFVIKPNYSINLSNDTCLDLSVVRSPWE